MAGPVSHITRLPGLCQGSLLSSGDPIGAGMVFAYPDVPSPYGPVATVTWVPGSRLFPGYFAPGDTTRTGRR
jgi:hypothetical protein